MRIYEVRAAQTHCKRGHLLSGENLLQNKDGRRRCRLCSHITGKRNHRKRHLKKKYNISEEDFERKLLKQDSKCAICKSLPKKEKYEPFKVDHNHQTNQVRGLLCSKCNIWLAALEDVSWKNKAEKYLEFWNNSPVT